MDSTSEQSLAHLIRSTRIAALGTIHEGEPNQAMVAIACENDFSAFYIHVSKLGKHTTDIEQNPQSNSSAWEISISGRSHPKADASSPALVAHSISR